MKIVLLTLVSLVCLQVSAEEKTCTVKHMDCAGCVDKVKEQVCTDQFSTCDVKIKDKKKKIGEIHVVTKDAAEKVDAAMLTTMIADTSYTVDSCASPKTTKK